jgi:hypothetical protein
MLDVGAAQRSIEMLQFPLHAIGSRQINGDPPVEYFIIELMRLADGDVHVGVNATVCEALADNDFELVNIEMASARVRSFDEALAVIRTAVVT